MWGVYAGSVGSSMCAVLGEGGYSTGGGGLRLLTATRAKTATKVAL